MDYDNLKINNGTLIAWGLVICKTLLADGSPPSLPPTCNFFFMWNFNIFSSGKFRGKKQKAIEPAVAAFTEIAHAAVLRNLEKDVPNQDSSI